MVKYTCAFVSPLWFGPQLPFLTFPSLNIHVFLDKLDIRKPNSLSAVLKPRNKLCKPGLLWQPEFSTCQTHMWLRTSGWSKHTYIHAHHRTCMHECSCAWVHDHMLVTVCTHNAVSTCLPSTKSVASKSSTFWNFKPFANHHDWQQWSRRYTDSGPTGRWIQYVNEHTLFKYPPR